MAPKGNIQLETGLERLREHLFNPDNRRRVRDNLTHEQCEAINKLRNLPNTNNAQVCFEDKGSRFVIRNLDYQDKVIVDQLADVSQFDEVIEDPTQRVVRRIEDFCEQWKNELEDFHPNIISFLTDLSETKSGNVKGLVKCHKQPREDGWHDIRLLLSSSGTPAKPASKLFQFAISHIFQYLESKMKDTKAVLQKIIEIRKRYPNGLPPNSVNIGCDVKKLYPSVDSLLGLIAVENWLQLHPNPDGLPTELILDLGKIC
jgi:hypothetical protein